MGESLFGAVTMGAATDPADYVEANHDQLIDIIRHSNDEFVRALCLAAIYEYGSDPSITSVIDDLERIDEKKEDRDD